MQTIESINLSSAALTHEAANAAEVVERWHDREHDGRFWLCQQQPCHAVNRVDW